MYKTLLISTLTALLMLGCESSSSSDSNSQNSSATSNSSTSQSSSLAQIVEESSSSMLSSSLATASSSSQAVVPFTLSSTDITEGEYMDLKFGASEEFSGDSRGQNISPELEWSAVEGATSYAIEMIDLDYSDAIHWRIINIPASSTSLPQGVIPTYEEMESLENDYGVRGYTGPFPPTTHNYKITVYAVGGINILSFASAKNSAIDSASITVKFKW